MLPYSTRLSRLAVVGFFVVAILYGIYEAQGILLGPSIEISEVPTTVSDEFIRIQGTATHIASLSMNGAEIPVTETGGFDEPFLLAHGENRITLEARDKYGNVSRKVLAIIYAPTSTPPTAQILVATSTHSSN
jgi:uncharacterized protein YfaP (DUF2135 family)